MSPRRDVIFCSGPELVWTLITIALVAAVLFPVFRMVRENARRADKEHARTKRLQQQREPKSVLPVH